MKKIKSPLKVKVLVITTYEYGELGQHENNKKKRSVGEAQHWYQQDKLKNFLPIPGTFAGRFDGNTKDGLYNGVFHNDEGDECLIVTGMGQNNAASSLMAVGMSNKLDLSEAYLLVAGIAGGNPNHIGLGSVAWANWVVSGDLATLVPLRELPPDSFIYPLFHLGCTTPWPTNAKGNQGWSTGTEVVALNHRLTSRAHELSKHAKLTPQNKKVRNFCAPYDQPAAKSDPAVVIGDAIASDNFYHGRLLGEWAEWWMRKWTLEATTSKSQPPGVYTTSVMEDIAFATAAQRLAQTGRIQFDRLMMLRGVGNFDRPHPGQTTIASLGASDDVEIAFTIAMDNLYKAGSVVVHDILDNWDNWRDGPPCR